MKDIAEAIVDIVDRLNKLNSDYWYLVVSEKTLDALKQYINSNCASQEALMITYIGTHIEDFEIVVARPNKREKYHYKNLHRYVNRLYNTRVLA